jgi:hypothetical protein
MKVTSGRTRFTLHFVYKLKKNNIYKMRNLNVNGKIYEYDEETTFSDIIADLFVLKRNIKYHVDISFQFDSDEPIDLDLSANLNMLVVDYIDLVSGEMSSQQYGDVDGVLKISVNEEGKIKEYDLF